MSETISGDTALSQEMTALIRCKHCGETAGISVFIAAFGGMVASTAAVSGYVTISSRCPRCERVSDLRLDVLAREGSTT